MIEAINSSKLDTPTARQKLQGEAAVGGNSLLAGNQKLASFYPVKELTSCPEETIFPSNNTAVVKVRQGTSLHYSYMFFQKDQFWKLTAIRTPCWNRTSSDLSLQPDNSLIAWFKNHREALHELKPLLQNATGISSKPVFTEPTISLKEICVQLWAMAYHNPSFLPEFLSCLFAPRENAKLEAKLRELGFASAYQSQSTYNSTFPKDEKTPDGNFYLGLPSPNCSTALIIFSPQDNPPGISPNGFIWLKKLDPHWYLARSASYACFEYSRSTL